MTTFHIDSTLPEITPARRLAGWRSEFCVELLGNAEARIFVRAVQRASFTAAELQQAILFCRLDTRFADLPDCIEAIRADLEQLVDSARRTVPVKDNLFTTVEFERSAWERVQTGLDRWSRRPNAAALRRSGEAAR